MKGQLKQGDSFTFGMTRGNREWPKHWRDDDKLILDEEVEKRLGV
jgi:hypothetical protein